MMGWNKTLIASILLVAGVAVAAPAVVATDANPPSTAQLELRANQAFNRGEYNSALPILKKLSVTFANEPGRLAPLKEKIRVCEMSLASLKTASPVTAPAANISLGANRKPHPAPKPGEVAEMLIKELGNFDYDSERGGIIPFDVRRLSNSTVRLRGFMIPMDQAENITQFALVPSIGQCCLGGPPQVQHTVVVNCPKGKAVGYCPDEIMVEGTLKVGEKIDDGYIVSIFEVAVQSVKPAPK